MASARIGGVGRKAAERGVVRAPLAEVDLTLLTHTRELEVLRCLEELPRWWRTPPSTGRRPR